MHCRYSHFQKFSSTYFFFTSMVSLLEIFVHKTFRKIILCFLTYNITWSMEFSRRKYIFCIYYICVWNVWKIHTQKEIGCCIFIFALSWLYLLLRKMSFLLLFFCLCLSFVIATEKHYVWTQTQFVPVRVRNRMCNNFFELWFFVKSNRFFFL